MLLFEHGGAGCAMTDDELGNGLATALDKIGSTKKMLIIPPDITRVHSRAGVLTRFAYERNPDAVRAILPALGTHVPMTDPELDMMFGPVPHHLFAEHRWRSDCTPLGEVPSSYVKDVSGGALDYAIPVAVNRMVLDSSYDCILSLSQVVPHEVAGMAGYSKNIVVGLGGVENIHKTHFLGAVYGMERIMGRSDSPVRKVLNYVTDTFLASLPIVHAITVIGREQDGSLATRGLFIGNDEECFVRASRLSQQVNISLLDNRPSKMVVYLDPHEYKSTWLGNKAVYRTRMAIADGGELVIVAPGISTFGEDPQIDRLVRTYGYRGTEATLEAVRKDDSLKNNLSAAAHLIHGSSEGRFSITLCPGGIERTDVESVGFRYGSPDEMLQRYDPAKLQEGHNRMDNGEEIFFISNPGTGLWAWKDIYR